MKSLAIFALALCACPPNPTPPVPDSGDAATAPATCDAACANLAALGCAEGSDPKCVSTCKLNVAQPITVMPIACWATAPTKEAARACATGNSGHLACP